MGNDNTRINSDSYVFVGNNNVGRGDDNTRIDKMKPLFDELADATLERVQATYCHSNGRGSEYGDTWRECEWLTMRAVMRKLVDLGEAASEHDCCRAIALAAFIDQKKERMRGGYKDDNLVDSIAYECALAELIQQLEKEQDDRDNTAGD